LAFDDGPVDDEHVGQQRWCARGDEGVAVPFEGHVLVRDGRPGCCGQLDDQGPGSSTSPPGSSTLPLWLSSVSTAVVAAAWLARVVLATRPSPAV